MLEFQLALWPRNAAPGAGPDTACVSVVTLCPILRPTLHRPCTVLYCIHYTPRLSINNDKLQVCVDRMLQDIIICQMRIFLPIPSSIAFSLIFLSRNEQRKMIVALSQDGGGGLGKSAGRYYGLGRESCSRPGRAARWQRRAAKEAAPWPGQ